MPKITECVAPESNKRQPKYAPYMQTIEQFLASGYECAVVTPCKGEEDNPDTITMRLRSANAKLGGEAKTGVRVRCLSDNGQKAVYLVRSKVRQDEQWLG